MVLQLDTQSPRDALGHEFGLILVGDASFIP